MDVSFFKKDISVKYSPLFAFIFFGIINALLSYFPLSMESWLLIGLVCFLPFFLWALASNMRLAPADEEPVYKHGASWKIPAYFPFLIISFGILLRLYLAVETRAWPNTDEGNTGFFSLEEAQNGINHFFYTNSQIPPFFAFCLAFLFKLFSPSLLTIRLLPAFFSSAALILLYWTGKKILSRSSAFLFLFLISFGFLPVYMGRFCTYDAGHFFWECLSLAVLTWSLYRESWPRPHWKAFLTGLCVGLGFWTAISWPVEALCIGLAFYFVPEKNHERWKLLFYFTTGSILFSIPFIFATTHEHYGTHILDDLQIAPNGMTFLLDHIGYLAHFFWHWDSSGNYVPAVGGFLNPVTGALLFVGFLELMRFRNRPFVQWIFLSTVLCMIPGFLCWGFDIHRVDQVTPFLFLMVTVGFQRIANSFKPLTRFVAIPFVLVLGLCALLDFLHLSIIFDVPIPSIPLSSRPFKPLTGAQEAYEILQRENKQAGPGIILTEFSAAITDQTLMLAVYPFNAARNTALSPMKSQWAAIVLNIHYRPFLIKRFPASRWYLLGGDEAWIYGDLALVIIPLEPSNRQDIESWLDADRLFREATLMIFSTSFDAPQQPVLSRFVQIHNKMIKDPFLETAFVERLLFFKKEDRSDPTHLDLLKEGLQLGYPLPLFWCSEGVFLKREGEYTEARLAFEKAIRSPLNFTNAEKDLKNLNKLISLKMP